VTAYTDTIAIEYAHHEIIMTLEEQMIEVEWWLMNKMHNKLRQTHSSRASTGHVWTHVLKDRTENVSSLGCIVVEKAPSVQRVKPIGLDNEVWSVTQTVFSFSDHHVLGRGDDE
jgi:hypothetical protein